MPPLEWRDQVREILEGFAARTPGSLIEEKTISLAWHYRMADPEFGEFQAHELTAHLTQLLSNLPVEIVADARVVEVRATGVSKGNVLPGLLAHARKGSLFVAMGDGRTDEELFAALPQDGVAIHVGSGPTRAQLRLRDVEAARRLLRQLLVS
jgi:trehalose 6-phosphate synthase/phosphatase